MIKWNAAARGGLPKPEGTDPASIDPGAVRAPGFDLLMALQGRAFHGAMYAGTADPAKVAARRRRSKLAKASRKRNRSK